MNGFAPYILVCDDEAPVRKTISIVLELLGIAVEVAVDGEEALRKIRGDPGRFTMLLTDHKMQPMDGLALVRELRALNFGGKIIVLSGCLDATERKAYQELGVNGVLTKPFDLAEFRAAISDFV